MESFRVFDEDNKGEIQLKEFRLIMNKYGNIKPEDINFLLLQIFEVKKIGEIELDSKVNYKNLVKRIF